MRYFHPGLLGCSMAVAVTGCVRWGVNGDGESGVVVTGPEDSDTGDPVTRPEPQDDDGRDSSSTDTGMDTGMDTGESPTPEPWPLGEGARVAVWGQTGIPTSNLAFLRNIYLALAAPPDLGGTGSSGLGGSSDTGGDSSSGTTGGEDLTTGPSSTGTVDATTGSSATAETGAVEDPSTSTSGLLGTTGSTSSSEDSTTGLPPGSVDPLRLLWVATCDPRLDPTGCFAGNLAPYFEMVAEIGTIDFEPLSQVDPRAYDVVIADFCGPIRPTEVRDMLAEGAHVLVLGDLWCSTSEGRSADLANALLVHLGTRFNGMELHNDDFLVPERDQVGVLAGIDTLVARGLALQTVGPEFTALAGPTAGAVLSWRE